MRYSPVEMAEEAPRRSLRKRKNKFYDSNDDFDEVSDVKKKRRISVRAFEDTRALCQQLLTNIMKHKNAGPFNQPVDPIALGIPNYFEKITEPMDFSSVQKKLDLNEYQESDDFARDMRLVFSNCRTYNLATSPIVLMCISISNVFEKEFKIIKAQEMKIIDNHEMGEMKSVIEELRAEHQKLLGELHKLVRDSNRTQQPASLYQFQESPPHLKIAKQKIKGKKLKKPKIKSEIPKKVGPFDLKQKELLSQKISSLTEDNIQQLVSIFAKDLPQSQSGELEIDLEVISDDTLRRIDDFVNECLKKQQSGNVDLPNGSSTIKKRKHFYRNCWINFSRRFRF